MCWREYCMLLLYRALLLLCGSMMSTTGGVCSATLFVIWERETMDRSLSTTTTWPTMILVRRWYDCPYLMTSRPSCSYYGTEECPYCDSSAAGQMLSMSYWNRDRLKRSWWPTETETDIQNTYLYLYYTWWPCECYCWTVWEASLVAEKGSL